MLTVLPAATVIIDELKKGADLRMSERPSHLAIPGQRVPRWSLTTARNCDCEGAVCRVTGGVRASVGDGFKARVRQKKVVRGFADGASRLKSLSAKTGKARLRVLLHFQGRV